MLPDNNAAKLKTSADVVTSSFLLMLVFAGLLGYFNACF